MSEKEQTLPDREQALQMGIPYREFMRRKYGPPPERQTRAKDPEGVKVWIVGQSFANGNPWALQGVFDNPEDADRACLTLHHFMGPAVMGESIPDFPTRWPGHVYPRYEEEKRREAVGERVNEHAWDMLANLRLELLCLVEKMEEAGCDPKDTERARKVLGGAK